MSRHLIVEDDIKRTDIEEQVDNAELDNLEDELQSAPSFEMPKKFEGKTAEDIARSYIEQEKLIGRQGAELGQMRKYVDSLIQRELQEPASGAEPAKPVEADDLLDRPEETIRSIIKKELESVTRDIGATKQQLQFNEFVRKHPNYAEVAQTPEFMEWVQSSERRQEKYQSANYNMNLADADELLSDWSELQSFRQEKAAEAETKRKKALRDASAERGAGEGSSGNKPKFKRSELRKMRMFEPSKFDAMQPEIIAAYREGRVIDG